MDSALSVSFLSVQNKWDAYEKEFHEFENLHKTYCKAVEEFQKLQAHCSIELKNHCNKTKQIIHSLKRCIPHTEEEVQKQIKLKKELDARQAEIKNISDSLPQNSGPYLKIVLGTVNVSFLKQDIKYKYKDEYERFKLIVTTVILIVSFLAIIFSYRALDAILHFLLVWYYCTLTIRESILVVNGSRIKGWWRAHHFITTILAGVIILWPDGERYHSFRKQLMWYVCYTSVLQFLEFYYQQGCLYRLRALGERHKMDITVDGFHSWMWRGLSFLLPFLSFGYCFQLYNAFSLYNVSLHPDCIEWQVRVSSVIFFILFLGNTLTTAMVIHQKLNFKKYILHKLK